MIPFLRLAAKQIFETYGLNELQNLQIVLPSRRSALYFKNELAGMSDIPFFSPKISSIDDFMQELSGLQTIENIDLYFEIFEIWKTIDPNQPFERFLTWAPTLVKDFNLLDSSLNQDVNGLFRFMSEAEIIKRWEPGLDNHQFTESSIEFFTFFDRMAVCYDRLKTKLLSKNLGYSGLIYRKAVENIDNLLNSSTLHFYFVGLNALTKAEEEITKSLVKAQRASFIWDTDTYYMESEHKAGKKLRFYKKEWGKEWNIEGSYLIEDEKNINVYALNSSVLEAKLAVDIAAKSGSKKQAIVVLDDSLFASLYLQLPTLAKKYNISAGMSFKSTQLSNLIDAFLNLIEYTDYQIPLVEVKSFLANPVLNQILEKELGTEQNRASYKLLTDKNYLNISRKAVKENYHRSKLLNHLVELQTPATFIPAIHMLLDSFIDLETDEDVFAYLLKDKLSGLENRIVEIDYLSVFSLKILMKELLKSFSVPFEKEPDADIQVMSLLETRSLDFEEVSFISFLEGNLPSGKRNNSFIPFDAASKAKLPLYSDQDAIMSYHFFRLLQRAKVVNLIYSTGSGGEVGQKEPSRFLYQIKEDLKTKNKNLNIQKFEFGSFLGATDAESDEIVIHKTPETIERIKAFLTERGLSPTSITDYLRSPVEFYWKYIAGIGEVEEDNADIGYNHFGTIVHYILEEADKPWLTMPVTKAILEKQKQWVLENHEELIVKALKEGGQQEKFDFDYGLNHVFKSIITELIVRYFDKRIKEFRSPFQISEIEKQYSRKVKVGELLVKVKGRIDKIERHEDRFVIIDFKTGMVKDPEIKITDEESLDDLSKFEKDKKRQLAIYYFLLGEQIGKNANIELKIYSFRNLDADLNVHLDNYLKSLISEKIISLIEDITNELTDAQIPFSQSQTLRLYEGSAFYELLG